MSVHSFLRLLLTVLLPAALFSTVYLHAYPLFKGCAFPHPTKSSSEILQYRLRQALWLDTSQEDESFASSAPPLQLLVLADPQLEGDTSLPGHDNGFVPRMTKYWVDLTQRNISFVDRQLAAVKAVQSIATRDIPDVFQEFRKRVDLFGNDHYLAHIYRTLYWWTRPTHVTVLGDLIGSQWLSDEEFEQRGWRYWNRVFSGAEKMDEAVFKNLDESRESLHNLVDQSWSRRIINIAGNHDIGYAGDVTGRRIERFERTFGRANWDIRFQYPKAENFSGRDINPTLHLIILNSLVLDTPALSVDVQDKTYQFVNSIMTDRSYPVEDRSSFTLLLTHVPLYKAAGICVDGPHFDFYEADEVSGKYKAGGLKEQNHLSDHSSRRGILEGFFGMSGDTKVAAQGKGRNGLILNGHDHEGCDVWHHIPANAMRVAVDKEQPAAAEEEEEPQLENNWQAVRWQQADIQSAHTGIREVTLRSMMGEFGGNAGLLSAWFDYDAGEWTYDIQTCMLGVQHLWWAIYILDLLTLLVGTACLYLMVRSPTNEVAGTPYGKMKFRHNNDMRSTAGGISKSSQKEREGKSSRRTTI